MTWTEIPTYTSSKKEYNFDTWIHLENFMLSEKNFHDPIYMKYLEVKIIQIKSRKVVSRSKEERGTWN